MASAGESPPNLCYSLGNGMHVSVNAGSVEQQLAEISRFTDTGTAAFFGGATGRPELP